MYVVDRFSAAGVNKVTVVYLNNDEYQFMEHTLVKRKNGRWMTDKGMLPQARTDNCKEYIALIDSKTFLEIRGREELRYPVSRTCLNLSPVISPPVVMATKSKVRPPDLVQLPPPEPVHAIDDPLLSPDLPQFHDLLAKNVYPPDCVLYRSGDQITMAELVKILELQEVKEIPALYEKALEWSTRTAHLRVLRWLCANVKTEGAVDAAILKAVQDAAAARAWAATTTMTKMTSIQGALKALFLYRPQQISIQLKNCTRWLLALKGLNAMVQLHQTQQPKAVTEAQLLEACRMEPKLVIRAALETAWLSAARGGDIRQIRAFDIKFPPPTQANPVPDMTVTFRSGKTAKRGQYTVGVPLPSQQTIDFIMERHKTRSWAFPTVTGEQLKVALRRVHPLLEQRSIRRGRLQHLAQRGMTDSQLLELSQHASLSMLRRYLDMGTVSSTTHETAALAAATQASL